MLDYKRPTGYADGATPRSFSTSNCNASCDTGKHGSLSGTHGSP